MNTLKTLMIVFCLLGLQKMTAQVQAVTEYGDTIYVYDNGTWTFEPQNDMPELANEFDFLNEALDIDTLENNFKVSKKANKQLVNKYKQFTVKYDDKIWKRVPPASLNDEAEFALQGRNLDIWCVVISEETSIDVDKLFKIAKNTMEESTGSKVEIEKLELRKVNGAEVLRAKMHADFSGLSFVFDTYYFSNEEGSVQFTTWTSNKLWERHQDEIIELLNGFVVN
ncbi:MAG: hypothetical protein N4A71_19630 [Carboxylicivirga sp.]|jgi:hypothetical protein|nr:hypothetical protein [Carboxylicivirga sp.]